MKPDSVSYTYFNSASNLAYLMCRHQLSYKGSSLCSNPQQTPSFRFKGSWFHIQGSWPNGKSGGGIHLHLLLPLQWARDKVLSFQWLLYRLDSKSHQKSSKCQNLLTGWHLELLGGPQLKETTCKFVFSLRTCLSCGTKLD